MAMRPNPQPSRLLPILTDRLGRLALRSAQLLLVFLLTSIIVAGLVQLRIAVIPVVLASILAAAFVPVVRWLRRHSVPRALAATVTLLGILIVIAALVFLVIYASAAQWKSIISSASAGFQQLQALLVQFNVPIDQKKLDEFQQGVTQYLTSPQFSASALAGISVVTELLTSTFLLIFLLFFFLKDGDTMWSFLLKPVSTVGRRRGERIGRISVRVLGGYARGSGIIALAFAVPISVALFVLQVPLALPLTVLLFLASFVPIVGGLVAGVLAVLVALVTNGLTAAIALAVVIVVVSQLVGSLVGPIVMSQSLRLHPLVVLLALTAGSVLGGIIGAVLAVPVAALAWEAVKAWDEPRDTRSRAQETIEADSDA